MSPREDMGTHQFPEDALPNTDLQLPRAPDPPSKSDNDASKGERFRITLAPVMLSVFLGLSFQIVTNYSLILFMVCHVTYNHSEAECRNYSSDVVASAEVQNMAADISMYKTFVEVIPGMIICIFVGSWSDHYGRKWPMIVPAVGFILSALINLIAAASTELSPWFLLLSSSFLGATGNLACFLLGAFSYISDISSTKTRTLRLAIIDLSMFGGLDLGIALSGAIYGEWGYVPSYAVALFLYVFAFVYLVFFTKESLKLKTDEVRPPIGKIFRLKNITETFQVILRRRQGNQRLYIFLLMISLCCLLFPILGESSASSLYLVKKFHWSQTEQSYFAAFTIFISIIGTVFLFRFVLKRFPVPDPVLGIIGSFGFFLKALVMAFSQQPWELYVGVTLTFFNPIASPVARSVITKIVTSEEQGKVYAFMTMCETAILLFATTVYTTMYKATEQTMPSAFYLFTGAITLLSMLIFSWLYFDMKRQKFPFNGKISENERKSEKDSSDSV